MIPTDASDLARFTRFRFTPTRSKWDYDDFGYLWADDEEFETDKDRMAMERKR